MQMGSPEYKRAWALIIEMGLNREIVFSYVGNGAIRGLSFPTKEDAMMFRLRL